MSLSQRWVRDLIFADVTAAKAAGRPDEICYVQSMKTFYDYVVAGSGYTANDTSILSTGNGGDTRWIARAGQQNITEAEITLDVAGAVTVTQMRHKVDTFENAASDDLVTLNGGTTVDMVVLRAEADARTIVVKHGTGNIWLQGKADISLDDLEDGILLFWDSTNSKWFDIGGGGGGAGDVTAAANITDNRIVRGNGGAKGVQESLGAISDLGVLSGIIEITGLTAPLTIGQGGSGTTGDSVIKAWIQFNGTGTIAIQDSFNVTSITDNGIGDYTITWNTDFANDDYAITGLAGNALGVIVSLEAIATGSVQLVVSNSAGAATDRPYITAIAIGDQ